MAWDVVPSTRDILRGDFGCEAAASAWYAGQVTVAELATISLSVTSTLTDQLVRTEATLVVDDDEGRLVPYRGADVLAPYGQQVSIAVQVTAGDDGDMIPLGRFGITKSDPDGSWLSHLGVPIPTGGSVSLAVQDILQPMLESELPGLMQPTTASAASEMVRLFGGICPVDTTGLGALGVAVARSTVYEPVRLNSVMTLLRGSDLILRASRDGVAEFVQLPTTITKQVTLASGEWVGALMTLDRDGVYNTVVTTSDQADSRVSGMAREVVGPFAATGPLLPRIYRHSSPLYTSNSAAAAGARTLLASLLAERSLQVTAVMPLDPTVDCGDLHRVSLVPGSLEPTGRVVRLQWSTSEADMQVTYSIPRAEVETWIRPSDLQPA